MVWIDIVLLIIILWFAYKGFKNGFVVELTTLTALILAIWGALKYGYLTSNLLSEHLGWQGSYLPFVSFVVTFLVIVILVSFIGKLITKILDVAQLGILNRVLGLIFSVLKVGIILSLVVNGVERINKTQEFINKETINDSYLYHPLNGFAKKIYEFSNEHFDEVKEEINNTFEETEKTAV